MKEKIMLVLLALLSACNVEMKPTEPTPEPTPEPTTEPTPEPTTEPTPEPTINSPVLNTNLYEIEHFEITEIYLSASEIIPYDSDIPEMRSCWTVWAIETDTNARICIADDINDEDIAMYNWQWLLEPGQKCVNIYRIGEDPWSGNLFPVESFDGWY